MSTPAFERYIAPARRHPELWRLVLGICVVLTVQLLWVGAISLLLGLLARPGSAAGGIGTTPGVLVILLLSFAGLGFGTVLAARWLHRRGAGTLIGHGPTALRHFTLAAVLILGVHGAGFMLTMDGIALEQGLVPAVWLAFLPLALLAVLIQTGAEEVAFRGYLQQQLAARFASRFVWMVLPSLAFGFLHYEPGQMGDNVWLIVGVTGLFGLVAADLTARSGTLGLAWGLHFANNVFALLIVVPRGDLSGLALFQVPFGPDDVESMPVLLLVDAIVLGVIWAICRLALRRG